MSEKVPKGLDKVTAQHLSDLGYTKDIRSDLSEEQIKYILGKNITLESFKKMQEEKKIEEERKIKSALVSEQFRNEYKEAYEKFVARMDEEFILDSEKERFSDILKICGSNGNVSDVEKYISLHKQELSNEEICFLEKTIDYKKAIESF